MTNIKAIIIEDEKPARDLIKKFLEQIPVIELVAECADGFEGLKAIQSLKPDLIFLDIQMPKITGFEMLELIENPPAIIFSTAFNEYALKAFEMNAVDYLLKPFTKERFEKAVMKSMERLEHQTNGNNAIMELINLPSEEKLDRIVVKTGNKIKVIPVETLLYLEAQDDYVMLYTLEGKYLKQQTMKYFEESLPSNRFARIHRSYIVNLDEIAQIENYDKDSHRLLLKNNAKLIVSKAGYSLLKKILKF